MSFYHTKYSQAEIAKLLKVGSRRAARPINPDKDDDSAAKSSVGDAPIDPDAAKRKLIESRSKIYLFDSLTPDEISAVIKNARFLSFGAGKALFKQGDRGADIFFLLSGGADIFVDTPDRQGEKIAQISSPALIGEEAFIARKPREVSCVSAGDETIAIGFEIDEDALSDAVAIATPFLRLYINITSALSKKLALADL